MTNIFTSLALAIALFATAATYYQSTEKFKGQVVTLEKEVSVIKTDLEARTTELATANKKYADTLQQLSACTAKEDDYLAQKGKKDDRDVNWYIKVNQLKKQLAACKAGR